MTPRLTTILAWARDVFTVAALLLITWALLGGFFAISGSN